MTVFCCFQFFNELEIATIKFQELYDVVDWFVVSESGHTHSGNKKPYYFLENHELFSKFSNKIVYQHIANVPNDYENLQYMPYDDSFSLAYNHVIDKLNKQTHWPKNVESYGRDSFEKEMLIWELLKHAKDDDIVILGDCDEIPKASTLKKIIANFDQNQVYHLQHDFYWYYLNILKTDETWYGNIVCSFKTFREKSFCSMRQNKQGIFVPNAGWHFSYMPVDRIITKIKSWGEQSLNQNHIKSAVQDNVKNCLIYNRDLFFRPAKFQKVNINYSSHPKWLVDNLDQYGDMVYEYR